MVSTWFTFDAQIKTQTSPYISIANFLLQFLPTTMENGAPPPENDMLARLRAEEFKSLGLEAELAVLRLKLVHDGEDLVAARSRCSKYKARWEHTERELAELRAKYEGLKRKLAPKVSGGEFFFVHVLWG
jgi:hypothetical protein